MTESIITISILGLLVGFIFSMPVAGPISILVTGSALKGRKRHANLITVGASFADFVYVFAAVFGLTNFYSLYRPVIPYILLAGTFFLIYMGIKILKTKIDAEHVEDKQHVEEKAERAHRGAFMTGFVISFLNPTLFISWLTSSFIIISMVSSLGFNVGGMAETVKQTYTEIHKSDTDTSANARRLSYIHRFDSVKLAHRGLTEEQIEELPKYSPLVLSLSYAFWVALGSIVWFVLLAWQLSRNRHRINMNIINRIIQVLGIFLCLSGLALGYKSITMIF
jgi:threonine/homoserine/homoserine lactone efflux protein